MKTNSKRGTRLDKATVIGLDMSLTDTGMAVKYPSQKDIDYFSLKSSKKDNDEARKIHIFDEIKQIVSGEHAPCYVFLEGYAFGKAVGKAFTRAELVGLVKYHIYSTPGIYCYMVTPSALKKYITGKGNCSKDYMQQSIASLYGIRLDNDNVADAYGLVQYGMAYLNGQGLTVQV